MVRPIALIVLSALTVSMFASPLMAQDTPDPSTPEPQPVEEEPAKPERSPEEVTAQNGVNKARKLAKLQRYPEAIALVEEAYLVLEDPELIRMLGEWHQALGDSKKAVGFFDTYLSDARVGDTAKDPVRAKRTKALAALGDADAKAEAAKKEEDDEPYDDIIDGWRFYESGENPKGGIYLTFGGHITHNEGASFNTAVGGDGPDADQVRAHSWVHGGLGLRLELGGYVADNIGLGVSLGNDWMNWNHRAPSVVFGTDVYSGIRPELAINSRYFFESSFFVGLGVGGDLMVLTQDSGDLCSDEDVGCTDREAVESGVQGWRMFAGPLVGYRSELFTGWTVGTEINFKYYPLFSASKSAIEDLPGFMDNSFMFNMALTVNWNL